MTLKQKQILELLKEMREKYGLIGVKGEFEAEGASIEELFVLRELTSKADVELTVKIGGCEAITDICFARTLQADAIVAPMIESSFAAKKFYSAVETVFGSNPYDRPEMLINIETKDGVRNLGEILLLKETESLAGLDIGRVDMAGSYGLAAEESNGEQVFSACRSICEQWHKAFPKKPCTIGGFLTEQSIEFLNRLSETYNVQCESKKTIFSHDVLKAGELKSAFLKAIEFELMWYQNCLERYDRLCTENWGYFKNLPAYESRLREA